MLRMHGSFQSVIVSHIALSQRVDIINTLADLLERRESEIMEANQLDLRAAAQLEAPLRARLKLDSSKLKSLREGTHVHMHTHRHSPALSLSGSESVLYISARFSI